MSKKKFFKKLLVAGLCALTATATIGTTVTVTGCKKDDENKTQTVMYNVTFKLGYEGAAADQTKQVEEGSKVAKPEDPTRAGYKFDGWLLEDGSLYNFDAVVSGNIVLTAKWTVIDSKTEYAVTWNLDYEGAPSVADTKVKGGEKVTKIQDPSRTGYDFICWLDASGKEYDFNSAVNANLTLKAKWEKHVYKVTFKFDEVIFDIQHVRFEDTASEIATNPAKPGKVFKCWIDSSGKEYDFNSKITGDTVLTASWTDKTYESFTVTFETNGGTAVDAQEVNLGGKVQEPEAPTKENFKFDGWYVDGQLTEAFDFASSINKATTLYAKWALADDITPVSASTTWEFNAGNIANQDEANNYFVATSDTVNLQGSTGTFNGLNIDATTGKLTSNGNSWYQFNATTKISFAVNATCSVKLTMYQDSTGYTVNGEAANATHTYNFFGANIITIESTANGYLGKIELEYPKAMDVIDVNTKITFGSAGNYNSYKDDGKLVINGSPRDNGADNTQFGTATVKFGVNAGAKITVNSYPGYTSYQMGMEGGELSEEQTGTVYTYTAPKAGNVIIVGTNNNNYYYSIEIAYDEGDVTEIPDGYELITTECSVTDLANLYGENNISSDITYGNFVFGKGLRFEKSKGCINTQGKDIVVTLNGKDKLNSLSFKAESASGKFTGITVKNSKGDIIDTSDATGKVFSLKGLPSGTYTIVSNGGSSRISSLVIGEVLEQSTPASMVVKPVKVDFLKGAEFSSAGVSADVTYGSGAVKSKANLTIDDSSVNMNKEGEYVVRVFYTELGETVTATYIVTVYSLESLSYTTYTTSSNNQTTLPQIYKVGGKFSVSGLTVNGVAKYGEKTKVFMLNSNDYDVSTPDLSTEGEKTVTITAKSNGAITASFKIYVVNLAEVAENTVTVTVDPSKPVSSTNFQTVTQAVTYIGNYEDSVKKVINIADGEYKEKIHINVPNVTLIGSATATPDHDTNNGVILWYDAISGGTTPTGGTYGTSGSSSVTIGSKADNFVAKNITFKNYYNSVELYLESKAQMNDTQAVALSVDSEHAAFYNCKMTSYHDTLLSNRGNHYYKNCFIEGRTDYIFGQEATVYFDECTIYTLSAGENDKDGGYIAAFKSSATTYVVFNECDLTGAEEGATEIALGRPWGADFKMITINSKISGNYSKKAHEAGVNKKERYVTMSGNEPKPENMLEYNNTGDGAITESIANTCTVMTAEQAAKYAVENIATILGFIPENL